MDCVKENCKKESINIISNYCNIKKNQLVWGFAELINSATILLF